MLLDSGCHLNILSYPQQPLFRGGGRISKYHLKVLYIILVTCIEARLNMAYAGGQKLTRRGLLWDTRYILIGELFSWEINN
jgi:hypothetical protein